MTAGDDDVDRVTLKLKDGVCSVEGVVLQSDGSLLSNGRAVGSWSVTASGFTVTTSQGTVTCTRSSGSSETTSSSGSTSNGSSAPSAPPAVVDAG